MQYVNLALFILIIATSVALWMLSGMIKNTYIRYPVYGIIVVVGIIALIVIYNKYKYDKLMDFIYKLEEDNNKGIEYKLLMGEL